MSSEWDSLKAALNLQKHNVDFADAATALDDDLAITIREEAAGEERFVTLGTDALGRLLVVVYTWRKDRSGSYQPGRQRPENIENMKASYEERI